MNSRNLPEKNVIVHVDYNGEQHELHTFKNEYRSLMMLIYDRIFTEGFGECLGMGKCGTCLVEIMGKHQEPTAYERNEHVNLLKAGYLGKNVRLSCQLMIDEKMNGLRVKIVT
jgi:2Fe-2S ferredoxin